MLYSLTQPLISLTSLGGWALLVGQQAPGELLAQAEESTRAVC